MTIPKRAVILSAGNPARFKPDSWFIFDEANQIWDRESEHILILLYKVFYGKLYSVLFCNVSITQSGVSQVRTIENLRSTSSNHADGHKIIYEVIIWFS